MDRAGTYFPKKISASIPVPDTSSIFEFQGFSRFLHFSRPIDGVLGFGIPELNFKVCVQLFYPLWVFSRSRQFLKHRKHMKNTGFQANFDLSVRVAKRSYTGYNRSSSTDDNRVKGQSKSAHSLVGAASRRLLASAQLFQLSCPMVQKPLRVVDSTSPLQKPPVSSNPQGQ